MDMREVKVRAWVIIDRLAAIAEHRKQCSSLSCDTCSAAVEAGYALGRSGIISSESKASEGR
jgi:hypothetical protein